MKAVHRALSDDRASSILEFIGEARNILVIGEGLEELLRALDESGCTVSCALIGAINSDEARVFCQNVSGLASDARELPRAFDDERYQVVLFDGGLERLADPLAVLYDARGHLEPGGCVVASIRNVLHGSVRLSVIAGRSLLGYRTSEPLVPFDSATANKLFDDAHLVVTRVAYDRRPLFGDATAALGLKRTDFSRSLVEEIEKDPRSEIYQFFVKASVANGDAESILIGDTASILPVPAISQRPVDDRAANELQLELEGERATREQLLTALADLTAVNATLQERMAELTKRRLADENTESLRRTERNALDSALETFKAERQRLRLALSLSFVALKRSGKELELAENAWYALYDEMTELREGAEGPHASHRHHVTALESRVGDLESETAWKQHLLEQAGAHSKRLEEELDAIRNASLADKAVMQAYADDVRERSERVASELRGDVAAATERERRAGEMLSQRVDDLQTALRETESRLAGENRELRERVAAAEGALATQTDAVIASMQAESAQLSQLVDTVQSSHFWRFKRWLTRLRSGLRS